jgi:phosphatidylglycerophosphate synthase
MLGKKLGRSLERPLARLAVHVPFTPNTVTISGFIFTMFACSVLASDLMTGGILVLAAGFFDMMDGAVARARNMVSSYGAFLDSVLDRYADAGILLAVSWNMFSRDNTTGMLLALSSLVGSFLVSYARARAEGLGVSCSHGLMERPERIILISAGTITGHMIPVLWVMTVLTHYTVIQRIVHTRKMLSRPEG